MGEPRRISEEEVLDVLRSAGARGGAGLPEGVRGQGQSPPGSRLIWISTVLAATGFGLSLSRITPGEFHIGIAVTLCACSTVLLVLGSIRFRAAGLGLLDKPGSRKSVGEAHHPFDSSINLCDCGDPKQVRFRPLDTDRLEAAPPGIMAWEVACSICRGLWLFSISRAQPGTYGHSDTVDLVLAEGEPFE